VRVTGKAIFGDDVQLPGLLHGKVLPARTGTHGSFASILVRPKACQG
jgi:hypothetical protein